MRSLVNTGGVSTWLLLIFAAPVAVFLGCSSTEPYPENRPHMITNFFRAGEIQSALLFGDLEGVRRPARWLSEYVSVEGLPPAAVENMGRIMRVTGDIAVASTFEEAAELTARLASTCGDCHAATDGGPDLVLDTDMPPMGDFDDHMRRHIWSMDRMWEGLIGPNSEYWEAGARGLFEVPLGSYNLPEGVQDLTEYEERVHFVSTAALDADNVDERVRIYGQLLTACAACHEAVGMVDP